MKLSIFVFLVMGLSLTSWGQKKTCQSLHIGTFKVNSKDLGTTIIKRTKNLQIEENAHLGYKLAYDITWTSDCTYELSLKQVIKGDPSLMNDSKYVMKVRIKQIKKNSYITENSSTFSDKVTSHEIIIVQ
jgi:hypothetical protein